jgi:nucleotide-binding universal stress UspA family protein
MTTKLFDSVIIGFDGREQAEDALALGRLLASNAPTPSKIVLAYVVDNQPPFVRQTRVYAQERRERVHEVLEPALAAFGHQARVEPASIDSSSPARGLHDLASEFGIYGSTVIVIGSTHRGPIGRVMLGSVGEMLVSGAPCPVTAAPRGFAQDSPESIAGVVVGFDGSTESRAALVTAHELARAMGVSLRAVAVAHRSPVARHREAGSAQHRAALEERLDQAVGELDGDVDGTVVDGDPVKRLAEAADGAGMLVLGARGYGPLHHVLVGSVSSKLMRLAPSPVLVLPRPAPGEDGASEATASKRSA